MRFKEKKMWEICIEEVANLTSKKYGVDVVNFAFSQYSAHRFYDLASCYYEEIF